MSAGVYLLRLRILETTPRIVNAYEAFFWIVICPKRLCSNPVQWGFEVGLGQ